MTNEKLRKRPARERLMAAAAELFYAHGMTATGIDAITDKAGVARKSLYNNFASKDDLIVAYIQARHQEWLGLYEHRSAGAASGRDQVLAVFDAYIDHAEAAYIDGFRGCGLLNAAAELPASAPGRVAVREHKEEVESILGTGLAEILDPDRAASLAEQLSFILEGAVARAGLEGTSDRLVHARAIANSLMETQ
ncbi:TetR family transcriptional regulator [Arthrobacter alpinus]|uniref:TetR/AcrR family transcriptional regulator n=1 Tax=Arthrobacter alpinus TaxID=656366 RepID=UPI0005CAF7EF|nr:TetR/AcrR family transcriptional regulator [Arthrobacter alpinus]ALV45216.1 TetR family transcriptional regulator [Arthrobacter alpinus]